jgi:CubicO group peptidase (beta-lactamase class C family)
VQQAANWPYVEVLSVHLRFFAVCLTLVALQVSPHSARTQAEDKNSLPTAEELQSLLEKARVKHDVPAVAAGIIRPGEQRVAAVVGVRKRDTDIAATVGDRWHIGSNTKPFTAFLMALLIDEGLLDWDTPLGEIFPEDAKKWSEDVKAITPAHLLTHTSGLPAIGPLLKFLTATSKETPVQDRERIIQSLDSTKLIAKPGQKYQYSNLGYVVLAAILDKRGKASWEEQLEKKICRPLGMKEWGLGPVGKKDEVVQPWPHQSKGKPVPADGVMDNPPVMNSAGRIHMSVADYTRFLAETLKLARGEKGLLKPATAEKLFTNPYPVSPHSLGGWLGFRKEPGAKNLALAHDGSNTFNYCTAVVLPDRNTAFCVVTNQGAPGGPGAKVCQELHKQIRDKIK